MSRLTIVITDQQHKSIKAMETFLKPRIEAAEHGEVVSTSVMKIFEAALAAPQL